jgi:hypothetical protein
MPNSQLKVPAISAEELAEIRRRRARSEQQRVVLNARHAEPGEFLKEEAVSSRPRVSASAARYAPPLPARVRRAAAAATKASLSLIGTPTGPKAGGRGAFRTRTVAVAAEKDMRRISKAGRGAFRLRVIEVAGRQAEHEKARTWCGALKSRRYTARHVTWMTAGPTLRPRRAHRWTGQPKHRPRNDDTSAKHAVGQLQKLFHFDRSEAENLVIDTMQGTKLFPLDRRQAADLGVQGTKKLDERRERSLRERLRK